MRWSASAYGGSRWQWRPPVEDNASLLAITAEHLKELGYRLSLAGTATEALEILNGTRPVDILFSDVVLPGNMNGMQLAAAARRLRPVIKVLLTSGYPVTGLATQHGFDRTIPFLQKPYHIEELTRGFGRIASAA